MLTYYTTYRGDSCHVEAGGVNSLVRETPCGGSGRANTDMHPVERGEGEGGWRRGRRQRGGEGGVTIVGMSC